MVLGRLLGAFIAILVGAVLVPTVANSVDDALRGTFTNVTNVTGAANTILNLTTLFFALAVTTVAISAATQGLKEAGIV